MTGKNGYCLAGEVVERESRRGVPDLLVEIWDNGFMIDDLLGSSTTDEAGRFTVDFDPFHFQELHAGGRPDVYFKVFAGRTLLTSTEDVSPWNEETGQWSIGIPLSPESIRGDAG